MGSAGSCAGATSSGRDCAFIGARDDGLRTVGGAGNNGLAEIHLFLNARHAGGGILLHRLVLLLQLEGGGRNQRLDGSQLFHGGGILAGQQQSARVPDGLIELGLSGENALGLQIGHGLLDLGGLAVALLAGLHDLEGGAEIALAESFFGFFDGGVDALYGVLLAPRPFQNGSEFVLASEGLGLRLQESNRFINLAAFEQALRAPYCDDDLFAKFFRPLLSVGEQDAQLVVGGLLHGGFQRRNCLLIFFFREQALSLFGGSIHAAALVKVGIFIAGQLEEALDLSRAFDLGSRSLQDLDRAGKILLAAGFVGALHVIGFEFFGLLLVGALAHDGQERPQAAIAGNFLRSPLHSGQRFGGLTGIEQLASSGHLLFNEFLFLAPLALLFGQRFQPEQAGIAGEAGERLLNLFAGGLIGVAGDRVFDLAGEFFQIAAAGFLVAARGGQIHQCRNLRAGRVDRFRFFQDFEGSSKLAPRDIFAGFFQQSLQLLLLGSFRELFRDGGVQRSGLGIVRVGGNGVVSSLEGGIEIARSLGRFGAAHGSIQLIFALLGGGNLIAQAKELGVGFIESKRLLGVSERILKAALAESFFSIGSQLLDLLAAHLTLQALLHFLHQLFGDGVLSVDLEHDLQDFLGFGKVGFFDGSLGAGDVVRDHLAFELLLHPAEVEGKIFSSGETLLAVLGQRLVDHIFQIGREILQVILQRRRRLMNDLEQRRGGIFAIEGHHAGEQFVEHDAAGKDIGAAIHHLGVDLLGRHVSDGADNLAGAGHGIVANAGDAEIHDLAIAVAQHHEIGGLDVAMDDAAAVRVSQAIAGLHDVSQLFYDGDLPVAGDDLIERLAVEELHHQIGIALMIAQVIDDDDVGVLQHAGGFGLTVEALEQVGILGKAAGHHLDGDDALDEVIHRLVHDAHAALAQNFNDVVLADFGDRFL